MKKSVMNSNPKYKNSLIKIISERSCGDIDCGDCPIANWKHCWVTVSGAIPNTLYARAVKLFLKHFGKEDLVEALL